MAMIRQTRALNDRSKSNIIPIKKVIHRGWSNEMLSTSNQQTPHEWNNAMMLCPAISRLHACLELDG